ncbi:MAG: hypothetical protein QM765_52430 [Myxococcales bacterium]
MPGAKLGGGQEVGAGAVDAARVQVHLAAQDQRFGPRAGLLRRLHRCVERGLDGGRVGGGREEPDLGGERGGVAGERDDLRVDLGRAGAVGQLVFQELRQPVEEVGSGLWALLP